MRPTHSKAWLAAGWLSAPLMVAGLLLAPLADGGVDAPDGAPVERGVPAPAPSPEPGDAPSAVAASDAPTASKDNPQDPMGHPGWHHPAIPAGYGSEDDDEARDWIREHHAHAGMDMDHAHHHHPGPERAGAPPGHAGLEGEDSTLAAIAAPPPPHWLHGIALDEGQQDKIFAILHEVAAAQRKAQRTADQTHRQLAHIGMATDYSESNARKLSDQHAQAIAELTTLRIRTEKRILDALTSEQRRDAAHQAAHED